MEVVINHVYHKTNEDQDNNLHRVGYGVEGKVIDDEGNEKEIDIFFLKSEFPKSRQDIKDKIKNMIRGD